MSQTHINPALLAGAGGVHVNPGGGPRGPLPVGAPAAPQRPVAPARTDGPSFGAVLETTFSKHAVQRLERRQLSVDATTLQRLNDGVARAAAKGAREAVVLVDDTAFVVSVSNRTVITAVGRDQMRDHVFTNIDSAVIA